MTTLTDKHYETIMDCLDEFDFDKVHKVMAFEIESWDNAE